jgi:hypothetical protein
LKGIPEVSLAIANLTALAVVDAQERETRQG